MNERLVGVSFLAALAACLGCSSPSAGGRPHDGGMDAPAPKIDAGPADYYCPADAAGGGVCAINFCGTLLTEKGLAANPPGYPQSGADGLCNDGRVCVVGAPVPSGDAFQLTCVAPSSGALPFGAACSADPTAGLRCASDSLCVAVPGSATPQSFCSTLCRNDADCPSAAYCVEYPTVQAPDGSVAHVGMCLPASKIAAPSCQRESACPAGQGCVSYGSRTSLTVCKATGGTKTVGTACTSASDCLSGACYDRDFKVNGVVNRTYCSSVCSVNSDCGPDQVCARIVQNNNGTPADPSDDVVAGICQTLFVPIAAAGCGDPDGGTGDASCVALGNGSDACDLVHGLCYNREAVPGSKCDADTGCMLGGVCSVGTRFPGGYCQTFGCAPNPTGSTPAGDLCAGVGSACVQRGAPDFPLHACYAGCQLGGDAGAQMCLRLMDGYGCAASSDGQPANICLGQTGT